MNVRRRLNIAATIVAGVALGLVIHGPIRLAVALLVIAICLLVLAIERTPNQKGNGR